jgi:hypothetical protein
MTTETVVRRIAAVCDLPPAKQADCLLVAAERSLLTWQQHARSRGIDDLSCERRFLEEWWAECVRRFPQLAASLADPAWVPWFARGAAYSPPGR